MKFNNGAEIYTANGKKPGDLGQVIVDPHTSEVIKLVVNKGYLSTRDKVIPTEDIQQATEDRATPSANAKIDAYPDFAQSDSVTIVGDGKSDAEAPSPAAWYPPFWNQDV
jgi:uncharacterized protein YrrD